MSALRRAEWKAASALLWAVIGFAIVTALLGGGR